jgi:hypothetical protein
VGWRVRASGAHHLHARPEKLGDTEVPYFDGAVGSDKDVLGLDVAMQHLGQGVMVRGLHDAMVERGQEVEAAAAVESVRIP